MKDKLTRRSVLTNVLPAAVVAAVLPGTASADQPHMDEALEALRKARRELDAATTDKGGHRVKAIRLVNLAIAEVEKGIRFDRRH